jgi:hypothetical protein
MGDKAPGPGGQQHVATIATTTPAGGRLTVGKRSISDDVSAANSKMAQMTRAREDEEASLKSGNKKVRKQGLEQTRSLPKGKYAKWQLGADFSYPTPMIDRPRTTEGGTSFHFSHISISKESAPTLNGKTVKVAGGSGNSLGVDHAKYIEREGAAERVMGAEHAAYIEREGAAERTDPTGEIAEGIERGLADVVNETPIQDEASMLGMEDVQEGVPSIFSNISTDQFEREEYWRAVHRSEREAKLHSLILDPEASPQWWREMEKSPAMDEDFRNHALQVRESYRQWRAKTAGEERPKPFVAAPWEGSAERCGRAIDGARKTPGWNEIDSPLQFKSGRGGRVQFRFVAELPHELTAADRALIVQNFCDHLGSFSKDSSGKPRGMMYTAVIHAPDAHNDRRNYHLHVIAHDRPARFVEERNQWDFEVAETYSHKREDRVRHPLRQDKINEVSRKEPKMRGGKPNPAWHPYVNNLIAGEDFIPHLRSRFSDITNAVLKERGVDRRYDPRSYKDMGIDRTPTEHLGTRAAALEAIGVSTIVGEYNAAAIWRDAAVAVERHAKAVDLALRNEQADLMKLAEDVQVGDPQSASLRTLRVLTAERAELIQDVADDRHTLMAFDQMEAKAKSRAVRTRQTCLQLLTDIDNGVADRTTRNVEREIRARFDKAQEWIREIDRVLEPDRPKLAQAAEDVRSREERIKQIDVLLTPIKASLDEAARLGREQRQNRLRRDRIERDRLAVEAAERMRAATIRAPRESRDGTVAANRSTTARPKETTNGNRDRIDRLARSARAALAARESGPERPARLQSTRSLAGVQRLSERGVVRDHQGTAVPLPRIQDELVGPGGAGAGAGVRLARAGDRDDDAGGGEGGGRRGLTPAAPVLPAAIDTPSVEGVPLINPTIDPKATPIVETPAASLDAPVPEGLVPVRIAEPSAREDPNDRTSVDIGPSTVQETPTPEVVGPAVDVPATAPETSRTPGADAPVRPADGRRRDDAPSLFPLEESVPPTKPGTTRAEYEDWDNLIARISSDRIAVIRTENARGAATYDVPALSPAERALLDAPRFRKRTGGRLASIERSQQREVERLIRWITTQGRDPEKLVIEGRNARLGVAPESVRRLMRDWRVMPSVVDAIRSENDRRAEALRAAAAKPPRRASTKVDPVETDSRRAEIAAGLPMPEAAATPQVAELLRRLRDGEAPSRIQEAADAVAADAIAREDVHRHRIELSRAYNAALTDDALREARERDRRGGR